MKKYLKILGAILAVPLLVSTYATVATNTDTRSEATNLGYTGTLRVYVVEPESRLWKDYNRQKYHFAFLDFAYNDELSLLSQETFQQNIVWDGNQYGYSDLREDEIMVIAAVFNSEAHKGYADPPGRNPFDAYYVDAAAAAKPGQTGFNQVNEAFTHTIFVEKSTATWCPYCPAMGNALYNVYTSGDYPFYFVSHVADKNEVSYDYMKSTYNFKYYPTAFFDGGYKVLVGGYEDESYYQTRIESCGKLPVHDLNLSVSCEWIGEDTIQIDVSVTNTKINNAPNPPEITGPIAPKLGVEHEYTFGVTDPDEDDISIWVEWCEGCTETTWHGPYNSGENVILNHTWESKGSFTIRAKAKDEDGKESDWATLEISVPKDKQFTSLLSWLINNLTSRFFKIDHLMNYIKSK